MRVKPIFLLLFFLLYGVFAQWEPDIRLTYDDQGSTTGSNNAWSIASVHDTLYVVWGDGRDGNSEIYFKRSLDGGTTWDPDLRLTDDPAISGLSCVLARDTFVHVAWYDLRAGGGNFEIYYKRSTDAGVTWGPDTRLTYDPAYSWYQSLALTNQNLHVVWRESRDGNWDVFYKRSTDEGLTWGPDTNLTNAAGSSETPCITASGTMLHVLWFDNRDGGAYEIYYKRSTDEGQTWGPDIRLTNDPGVSFGPCAVATDSIIHVIWQDYRDGNWELYYKRSIDNGNTWGPDIRLTDAAETTESPSIAVSGTNIHTVWWDNRDNNYEIYYKISTDAGTSWSGDTRLTIDGSWSQHPHITAVDSMLHVVWKDGRAGNDEIYYKRNPTGNPGIEEHVETLKAAQYFYAATLFKDKIEIYFTQASMDELNYVFYDVCGTVILEKTHNHTPLKLVIDDKIIQRLPTGIYYFSAVSDRKKLGHIKLVKID